MKMCQPSSNNLKLTIQYKLVLNTCKINNKLKDKKGR